MIGRDGVNAVRVALIKRLGRVAGAASGSVAGKGRLVGEMVPKADREWAGTVACCGVNTRGVALWREIVVGRISTGG